MYRSDAFRADLVLVLGLVSSLAESCTLSFQNPLPFPPLSSNRFHFHFGRGRTIAKHSVRRFEEEEEEPTK